MHEGQFETRPGSKMNRAGWCPFALIIRCFFKHASGRRQIPEEQGKSLQRKALKSRNAHREMS